VVFTEEKAMSPPIRSPDSSPHLKAGEAVPPRKAEKFKRELRAFERGQIRSAVADLDTPSRQDEAAVPSIETQEERIRARAYEIWSDEGQPEGRQDEHWHRARQEIEAELAKKTPE
jgi:hypothetical protein